jgi:hypothetical protein
MKITSEKIWFMAYLLTIVLLIGAPWTQFQIEKIHPFTVYLTIPVAIVLISWFLKMHTDLGMNIVMFIVIATMVIFFLMAWFFELLVQQFGL